MFWVVLTVILLAAAGVRLAWTYVLQLPYVTPDSWSYLAPIVFFPAFPFSQARTAGAPLFIELGAVLFGGPWGILLLNNILALVSAALIAAAIKQALGQRTLALIFCGLVLFTPKGIELEYQLLSEHYARCFYLIAAALMLWTMRAPRLWISAGLAGVTVLNVLVKPSALVLIPAIAIALAAACIWSPSRRGAFAASLALFLVVSVVALGAYMAAFKQRFGSFDLSHFDGFNLFSHVGHLTVLDRGTHPDLKRDLRGPMAAYIEKYVSRGDYQPNWLVFGSAPSELASEPKLPDILMAYAQRNGAWGHGIMQSVNQAFKDLALEAMRERPGEYLAYAAQSAVKLWTAGYLFTYSSAFGDLDQHRRDLEVWRRWLFEFYRHPTPPCGMDGAPDAATGPARLLFAGPILTCALGHDTAVADIMLRALYQYHHRFATRAGIAFSYLPAAALVASAIVLLSLRWRRPEPDAVAFAAFLALLLLGYTAFHGLVNVAEPLRMTANVQDLAVLLCLIAVASAVSLKYPSRWFLRSRLRTSS